MYRIGEFSKLSKVPVKTLRYYDEIDLLKPEFIDKETNYRLYTTNQLLKIHNILAYRQIGLSIKEIKEILAFNNEEEVLKKRLSELKEEQKTLINQTKRINFMISGDLDEKFMNYNAVIKETPSGIVYSKKMTVQNYNDYFKVIPELGQKLLELNPDMKTASPEYCYIVHLDGEYKEENRNIEFCEMVDSFGNAPDGVEFKEIPSITVLSVLHKGSYDTLGLAYAYAMKWIEDNNYFLADNPRENYIDGIWNFEDEQDWLTEVQIPIKSNIK